MDPWKLLTAILLSASPAVGQSPSDDRAEARLLFQRGLTHVRAGNLTAALEAFRSAYATQPHFSVLYNIGQAQAALGQTLEAIASFEVYLAEGGQQVAEPRRLEVRALLEAQRKRLGALKLQVSAPERTRVWLDGRELRQEELDQPIALGVGEHTLLYSSGSGHPILKKVTVTSGNTVELGLPSTPATNTAVGQLAVVCDVPDFALRIDDQPAATTPIEHPLLVPVGRRQLRFSRAGYLPVSRQVEVTRAQLATVACDARIDPGLAATDRARLFVQTIPRDARVFINGQPFAGEALPFGRHALRVELDGYLPHRAEISVKRGEVKSHQALLVPTPTQRERDDAARRERRALAYVGWATGAAALLTAGSLMWWNQAQYQEWQTNQRRRGAAPDFDRIASIQRVDDISLGLVVLGAGLTASGTWAFFTSDAAVQPR